MAEQARELMTVDEFLPWDDGTDTRYELADGVIRAMAPPSGAAPDHRRQYVAGVHLQRSERRAGRAVAKPKRGLRIDERTMWQADRRGHLRTGARRRSSIHRLVVEVLSPSTRTHDLGRKLVDYKTLPSVAEIWMVDSERRWVQHWRR